MVDADAGSQEPLLALLAVPSSPAPAAAVSAVTSSPVPAAADLPSRSLYGVPKLAASYDEEYDERAAQWFELFIDLILVVAWSNVTDTLYESEAGSVRSLFLFYVTMNLVQAAWLQYMEYQTRFIDETFLHTVQLFLYILGLAGMAIHIGDAQVATEFTVSMLMQKIPVIGFCLSTGFLLKGTRQHMFCKAGLLTVSAAVCAAVVYVQPREYTPFVMVAWSLVVAIELPSTWYIQLMIPQRHMIPINIDHVVDRTNAFIMITLGESILSAMIKYGALTEDEKTRAEFRISTYYLCMAFVLVLAYSIGLLYYNIQPPRHESAFRRSAARALLCFITTCALAPAILLVSVGVKFCIHAIVNPEGEVLRVHTWMLYGGVALVLHLIFWLRVGHYGGVEPRQSDPLVMKKVKYWWWAVFAVWPVLPLCVACVIVGNEHVLSPAWNLGVTAGVVMGLVLVETAFTTVLESMLEIEFQPVPEAIEQR